MGETNGDRASLLEVLSNMNPHPESVPINSLVAIEGTGLEDNQEIDSIEMIRIIATARILMPISKIRLSAGREKLSKEAQILCFQCGANSIFYGDELLTTSNPSFQTDRKLLKDLGVSFNKNFETIEKNIIFFMKGKNYKIVSLYSFFPFQENLILDLKNELLEIENENDLSGLLIFASEGMNGTICAEKNVIDFVINLLNKYAGNRNLNIKVNFSKEKVFKKLKIKNQKRNSYHGSP